KLNFSFDPVTGAPTMTPSFQPDDQENVLEEVMMVIEGFAKKSKVVVVFDEFQEIENFKDDTFEKRLRKIIQRHQNICYVFMGSKRHLLTQMFNSKDRAFYKSSEHYPLLDIKTEHYITWIEDLFLKYDKPVPSKALIKDVVDICDNRPMYVQQFFYHLWDEDVITEETIKRVENRILSQNQDEFLNLWDALTLNQKKTLNLIIFSKGENIFYSDVIQRAGLRIPSQVKKSIEVLMRQDIILKNSHYKIQDIMFEKWIQRML
ncbi:DUF2075 domain-containing protein, partial [bacterium]|nr:DUF2075 domain-containing protein [bacterium]